MPAEFERETCLIHNGTLETENLAGDDSRVLMDRAIPFIRKAAAAKTPFLAVIWFHAPHEPVVAGPEYLNMYPGLSEGEQHYYGCITALDEQVGRLRKELRDLGVADGWHVAFLASPGGGRDYAAALAAALGLTVAPAVVPAAPARPARAPRAWPPLCRPSWPTCPPAARLGSAPAHT